MTAQTNNPKVNAVFDELAGLHDSKNQDYAHGDDPFKNFHAAKRLNMSPWLATEVRLSDKTARLESYLQRGSLNNESVRDTLIDRAMYAVIAVALYDEEVEEGAW